MTDKIAVIDVFGGIYSGSSGGSFTGGSYTGSDDIQSILTSIEDDGTYTGIILRINSPGGTVGAAQEIFSQIRKLRKKGITIVTSAADMLASGAYYIASATDRIFVNPGTMVGSIGVVTSITDFSSALEKIGVTEEVFKSGEFKDSGSWSRHLTERDREYFSTMISQVYGQFLSDVSDARGIEISDLKPLSDGRVFVGSESVKLNLADEIGSLNDAIAYVRKHTGSPDAVIVRDFYSSSLLSYVIGKAAGFRFQPRIPLMYKYRPGI